jgi:hypothetical protein
MRAAILPLLAVLCLLIPSCTKSKRDQCASILGMVRTEMRAEKVDKKLLADTANQLRAMEIRDARLKSAIDGYLGALGQLSDMKEGDPDLAATLTYLDAARRRIADECNR